MKPIVDWLEEWGNAWAYRPGVWMSTLFSENPDYGVDYSCLEAPKPWMTRGGIYTGFKPIKLPVHKAPSRSAMHDAVVQPLQAHVFHLPFIVNPMGEEEVNTFRYASKEVEVINGKEYCVYKF